MRKVVLFIAMSLDGYIADKRGGVDWLHGQSADVEDLDTYGAFIKDVDTVVMGWNTYHQIVTELSPGQWVYAGLTSYVVTHRALSSTDEIIYTEKSPCELVTDLRRGEGKKIWICGGANIACQLLRANLIDEFQLSIVPTILGGGIRLFEAVPEEIRLQLTHTQSYNGMVELMYTRG